MKKLLSIALAAGSMVALADTTIQGQTIGSIEIASSLSNTVVAVAFKELGVTAQNISVSNIVSTANLNAGDIVYVLVDGSYQGWTLTQDSGKSYKYWKKNDNTFSLNAGGAVQAGKGASSDEIRPSVGTGIWVQRNTSTSGSFYVYGAVPSSTTTTVTTRTKTLFGNPTNAAASPTITGAANGDQILIPTEGIPTTVVYNGTTWCYRKGVDKLTGIPAITKGTGAWYVSKGAANVTISWN